ncbi:MAG: type secretion system protein GspD, partial [Pseudomonadota bacterium]
MTMKPLLRPPVPQRLMAAALAGLTAIGGLAAPVTDAQAQQGAARRAAAANAGPKVTVNFVNAEIDAVARAMAAIVKRQILVDPRVRGQMTLYSEQPLTEREAFLNFMSALRGLGFTVIDVAGLLKIVPEAEAKLQTGTVSVGQVVRGGDQILTQVFNLKHENVNNLVTVLRPLISPNNTINANPGNNTLVITDYADNLQRLAKIIAALDTPAATDVEVVPVRHAVAADIAQMV